MRSAVSSGKPACAHRRVSTRSWTGATLPSASISLRKFQRDCASVMVPDRKASTLSGSAALLLSRSAARNDDSRASASGTAQGSPRWSAPPVRASSRRIRRAQSSAPVRIQADCVRARSAPSTWIARHCCQIMPAAIVATSVRISMASSRAAPRWRVAWCGHGICGGSSRSRVSVPARPPPSNPSTTRTPLGNWLRAATGADAAGAGAATSALDWALLQALPR